MKIFIKFIFVVIISLTTCSYSYDLDNNGWDDLIFSNLVDNSGNYFIDSYIYWGSETGYSETNRTGLPTVGGKGVSVADLNGDLYADIVFSNYRDGSSFDVNSYIYWGSASGYSAANRAELYTRGSWDNAVSDLNGDTYLDIVFTSATNQNNSYIYWGSESGFSDTNRQILAVNNARDVEIADLNGDNRPDIFIEHRFSDSGGAATQSYIYWGNESGFSDTNRQTIDTTGALGNCIADLNMDGKMDIIVAQYNNGTSYLIYSLIFWGDDANPYSSTTPIATSGATDVTTADLDGDGFLDIVLTNQRDDTGNYSVYSYILWGDITYSYIDKTLLPTIGASSVAVTDYNNDNYPDIVIAKAYDNANLNGPREIKSYIYTGYESMTYTSRIELPTIGASDLFAGPYVPQPPPDSIPEPLTATLMSLCGIGLLIRKKLIS